jgi:predicted lipid-binding transport protein (Tim44 family)
MNENPYNRFSGKHRIDWSRNKIDPAERARAEKARDDKMWWANVAPTIGTVAGTALGGIGGGLLGTLAGPAGTAMGAGAGAMAGATLGSQIGTSIGGGIGKGFQADAEKQMDPLREKQMREEALMMALFNMRR